MSPDSRDRAMRGALGQRRPPHSTVATLRAALRAVPRVVRATLGPLRGEPEADHAPPTLSGPEKACLLGLARAVVTHRLDRTAAAAVPPGLPQLARRAEPLFVTLWVDGAMRGCCAAGGRSLYRDTITATHRALEDARVRPLGTEELSRLRIEIDVLGRRSRLWGRGLDRLAPALEAGIHGITLARDGKTAVFKSSVAITKNWPVDELMGRLCEKGGWARDAYRKPGARLWRFRSTSFIEGPGGRGCHDLVRANVPVGARDWHPARIGEAIDAGAAFLIRMQRADGGFAYQYFPAERRFDTDDNLVRQVATAWLMVALARRLGDAASRAAADRAIRFVVARTHRLPETPARAVVAEDRDAASLGATAFGLLTMATEPDPAVRPLARAFAEAILGLQQYDGRFLTYFQPCDRTDGVNFYPGEAMLGLMEFFAGEPDPRYPEALRRAFPFYRRHFREDPSSAFAPWQMAAYARLARTRGEREYAEFVFEMADWLLPHQYTATTAPYPDYVGGYGTRPAPGITTATYNEGVLEAYALARQLAERERGARYQRAAVLAGLFTLRLQFTAANAFAVDERTIGGFRASLVDSTMRIDHTQHAVNSLLKAERYLARREVSDPATERNHSPESRRHGGEHDGARSAAAPGVR